LGSRPAVIRNLPVAAAVSAAMIAAPALAQDTTDPRVLRIDDTEVTLFDGMVTIARQDSYRIDTARTEVDDGLPAATLDILFTEADLDGGGCKLEMGRVDETDLEVVREVLAGILDAFPDDIRNRNSVSREQQGRILTHGSSNSINSERPYIATYVTTERGGHEIRQYWFTSDNGRIHGYLNECTLPGSADRSRLQSAFPLRTPLPTRP